MEISSKVRTVICEANCRISTCQNPKELLDIIIEINNLLRCTNDDQIQRQGTAASTTSSSLGIQYTQIFKTEFLKNHYSYFCEHVVKSMDPEFLEQEKGFSAVLQSLFLNGPAQLSFLVLASLVQSINHTSILLQIVSILNNFIYNGKFEELFFTNCIPSLVSNSNVHSQDVLQLLVSLPDQLANKMKFNFDSKFHPTNYYKVLGKAVINTLIKVHDLASSSQDFTTSFISKFIGKVALRGCVDVLLDEMLSMFKKWSYTSPLWASLCSQVLMDTPGSALEPVLENILKKITNFPFFCKLVKNSIHTNSIAKMLITDKFLFVRYYKDLNVLKNIIGYLCGEGRRDILMETAKKLLSHWGNSSTIKHSTHSQHLYITQAVVLSIIQANEDEIAIHKHKLLHLLLSGVQAHLESPNTEIRQLGMITAELVTPCLHPGSQKLKFEYEENDEVKQLKNLAALPKFEMNLEKQNFLGQKSVQVSHVTPNVVNEKANDKPCLSSKSKETPTVDEDLEPFQMNENDEDLIEGIQPPRYISECIDGLLCSDDYKRYTASLQVLNKVIINDKGNLPRLSCQLVTVLLHLQDKFSLEGYYNLRFSAMVSATVGCPVQVTEYLTKEFYAPNYSLRQRMDILDVLAAAAVELSKPVPTTNMKDEKSSEGISKEGKLKNWELIIQERVEQKTRRFGKKKGKGNNLGSANHFAVVAGHFFFPLLQHFDSRQNTFDLVGEDCMVLGSLVCTLGNIIYCARGAPVACNMAKCILEFVWAMRYHDNAHVRQALLFALAMVILSVPGFYLVDEVLNELVECQSWLENILNNDPSIECRKLAMQVLVSVRDVFQKQFNNGDVE